MTEEEQVKARKKKSFRRVLISGVMALLFIMFVIGPMYKNRVEDESTRVLEMHQLTPIEKVGDYSYIYQQQDWAVTRQDGTVDTVGVCLSKSSVIIDITIPEKKELPGKMIGR
jgi:hypothetical protein